MLSVQPVKYTPANLPKMQKVAFKGDDAPKQEDKANNGKFDFSEGMKQVGKGIISPITSVFSSVESAAITAGVVGVGLFVIKNVKQAGPILTALGTGFGLFQIGKGVTKVIKAEDGDAKEKALFHTGSGIGTLGLSMLTAKPILKNSGLIDEAANTPKSFIKSFQKLPQSIKQTYNKLFGNLDKANGDGLFVNLGKAKESFKGFKADGASVNAVKGTKEGVSVMASTLDPDQKFDVDLIRA